MVYSMLDSNMNKSKSGKGDIRSQGEVVDSLVKESGLALLLTSCVTLDQLLSLSEPIYFL